MMLVPDDEFDAAAKKVVGSSKVPTVDDAAANVLDNQRTQLRTSLYGALDANPDEAAKAKALSAKSGVPVDIVQRNYAQVNRNVQLNEFDETIKKSPVLGQWLSNPNNAKISHDDSNNLAGIEREYGSIKPIERSFLEEITEPFQQGYARFKKGFALNLEDTAMMKGLRSRQQAAAEANGISYDPKIQQAVNLANYQRNVEKFPVPVDIQSGHAQNLQSPKLLENLDLLFGATRWLLKKLRLNHLVLHHRYRNCYGNSGQLLQKARLAHYFSSVFVSTSHSS
jgi:hypothetical protein